MADCIASVHFGGPGRPARALRELLAQQIEAVPSGGSISWATYYLRDRELARALVQARRRGVDVRLVLEGAPRTKIADRAVAQMLSGEDGLGDGLRLAHQPRIVRNWQRKRPRLHTKLYCFSHPEPVAYAGSFNPSGDEPETMPDVIEEIRDQDRGYNFLVGLRSPSLVAALFEHADLLFRCKTMSALRPTRDVLRTRTDGIEVFSLPSPLHPAVEVLTRLPSGSRLRVAASHLRGSSSVGLFAGLARRGVEIEIVCDDTKRRVPQRAVARLEAAGVSIRRFRHCEGLPMHDKFMLIDGEAPPRLVFGSFNWTGRSRFFNHEVGAIAETPVLFSAFEERWRELSHALA